MAYEHEYWTRCPTVSKVFGVNCNVLFDFVSQDKASIFSFPLYRPTTTQTSIDLSLYISVGHAYSVNVEALMGDGLEIYIHVIQSDTVEFRAGKWYISFFYSIG